MTDIHARWMSPELSDTDRASATRLLSPAELDRVSRVGGARQDTFLAGRLLVRTLVAELVGADPIRLALDATCPDCREQHGQIVVPDYPIHVSLSHSRLAVIAVASARPIGVDVESTVQSIERLAAIGIVAGQPSIAGWTAVEAVLKADGRGLRVDPKRVEFEGFGEKLEARVTDRATRYSITEPFIRDGIHASIAVAI